MILPSTLYKNVLFFSHNKGEFPQRCRWQRYSHNPLQPHCPRRENGEERGTVRVLFMSFPSALMWFAYKYGFWFCWPACMSCKLMSLNLITASQIGSGLALVRDVSMAMMCVVQHAATALSERYSNVDLTLMYSHCMFWYDWDRKMIKWFDNWPFFKKRFLHGNIHH